MKSVYIETTIPSFFFETRASPIAREWRIATRHWWDHARHRYRLWTSRFVIEELSHAPTAKSRQALTLVEDIPHLAETQTAADVARAYIKHRLMPAEAGGDAFHLALASIHGIDFQLTWNCRHLANANKMEHLRVLNVRLGLPAPTITTPLNLGPEN